MDDPTELVAKRDGRLRQNRTVVPLGCICTADRGDAHPDHDLVIGRFSGAGTSTIRTSCGPRYSAALTAPSGCAL